MKNRVANFLLVALIAGGVSWAVTEWRSPEIRQGTSTSTADPISLENRQAVQLQETLISPIITNQGLVIAGEDEGIFIIQAEINPVELAYQLIDDPVGVRASISGGPSGFDCEWTGLGVGMDGRAVMQCTIPEDIAAASGLSAMMGVQLEEPVTTHALPVTAVRGAAERGEVVVVLPDGGTEVRAVTLGTRDAYNIEIIGGLEENEAVLVAPFGSDFRSTNP